AGGPAGERGGQNSTAVHGFNARLNSRRVRADPDGDGLRALGGRYNMSVDGQRHGEPVGRSRWMLWSVAGLGVISVAVRVGVATHSFGWGLLAGVPLLGAIAWASSGAGSQKDRLLPSIDPAAPSVPALLYLGSLPEQWRGAARESLGPVAGQSSPGMPVTLRASEGWLVVERRRRDPGERGYFSARAPLRAIDTVGAGPSMRTAAGSRLLVALDDGTELVLGLDAGEAEAGRLAGIFSGLVRQSRRAADPGAGGGLEISSSPVPIRESPSRGALMMVLFLPPYLIAMVWAASGAYAAWATMSGFVAAVLLMVYRPRWMSRLLSLAMMAEAAAFAVDAGRLDRPDRLIGSACCLGLGAALLSLARHAPAAGPQPRS
ncbi:MAG: hypothetical protein ACRDJU_11190, partial [Actinomycetota bacterium]